MHGPLDNSDASRQGRAGGRHVLWRPGGAEGRGETPRRATALRFSSRARSGARRDRGPPVRGGPVRHPRSRPRVARGPRPTRARPAWRKPQPWSDATLARRDRSTCSEIDLGIFSGSLVRLKTMQARRVKRRAGFANLTDDWNSELGMKSSTLASRYSNPHRRYTRGRRQQDRAQEGLQAVGPPTSPIRPSAHQPASQPAREQSSRLASRPATQSASMEAENLQVGPHKPPRQLAPIGESGQLRGQPGSPPGQRIPTQSGL